MPLKKLLSKFKNKILIITILLSLLGIFNINILTNANKLSILNQFTYGVSVENEEIPANVNLVAGPWILNDWQAYNTNWLSKFGQPQNSSKTPYLYLYVTAGKARADWGLQDCNVGAEVSKTLCHSGANYIRNNKTAIDNSYINIANNIKNIYGADREIALHLEPDFYQYSSSSQANGGLTTDQAAQAMNQWTASIKKILPNASLVLDVSPWNNNLQNWSAGMQNFDYSGMVGKRFSPFGDGSVPSGVDGKTYAQIVNQTGKKLIIDDSHGAGGWWLPFDYDWANQNAVQDRIKDGVVAVINPPNDINFLNTLIKPTTNSNSNTIVINAPSSSSSSSILSSQVVASGNLNLPNRTSVAISSSSIQTNSPSSQATNLNSPKVSIPQTFTRFPADQNYVINLPKANPNQIICSKDSVNIALIKNTSWNNGYITEIKVKNNSNTELKNWNINLNLNSDQKLTNSWNLVQNGSNLSPSSNWNKSIKPGQEVSVGGFNLAFENNNSLPEFGCGVEK